MIFGLGKNTLASLFRPFRRLALKGRKGRDDRLASRRREMHWPTAPTSQLPSVAGRPRERERVRLSKMRERALAPCARARRQTSWRRRETGRRAAADLHRRRCERAGRRSNGEKEGGRRRRRRREGGREEGSVCGVSVSACGSPSQIFLAGCRSLAGLERGRRRMRWRELWH